MPEIVDWVAATAIGHVRRGEAAQPPEATHHVEVSTDVGKVQVSVNPGERVRPFTRRVSQHLGKTSGAAVIEITPDPSRPDMYVRLYVTANGLVLTTKDL